MELNTKSPAQALNKAYLRQPLTQVQIDTFKAELEKVFSLIEDKESEDYHKNLISDFLKNVYYKDKNLINVNDKYDLIIRLGNKTNSKVGVILEFKKPTDKKDMLSLAKPNVKSFHQLVLYYLRETIDNENFEIKNLIITNLYEWYIFDELWFEENIFRNKKLVKSYKEWKVAGHDTKHFYEQIAAPYLETISENIPCTHFSLANLQTLLMAEKANNEKDLVDLYKILSPQHLLKQPFANDGNTLNQGFYNELLHILGLEEKSDKKSIIERKNAKDRQEGSLLENTIDTLRIGKYLDKDASEEIYFENGLELCITWLNRILFLKLLEGQLIQYHRGSRDYAFLNVEKIKDFDELYELFFEVLAEPVATRKDSVNQKFGILPYLNSSLFEHTNLEKELFFINSLKNRLEISVFQQTVLKNSQGKKVSGSKNTLVYLFEFLDSYNFSSEGGNLIQKENKTLINAAVLGLIFEKINGYKDGSFFTPSYITMYMCRETIRKAVVQKFNEELKWNCTSFEQLKATIDCRNKEFRQKANEIVNSVRICDPAVGSGHFLVSALNELIAIKSDLEIFSYRNGNRIHGYKIEVENDELIIIDEEKDILFAYAVNQNGNTLSELQGLQEALFHEKQILIENCLFGADINPKSVAICRLRLWIELLKNAYYIVPPEQEKKASSPHARIVREKSNLQLETLPNIDINIKVGNSLVSRYALDIDLSQVFKKEKYSIQTYKMMVAAYKNTKNKLDKENFSDFLQEIKEKFKENISVNDPLKKRLADLNGKKFLLNNEELVGDLFGKSEKMSKEQRKTELSKIETLSKKIERELSDKENAVIYKNAIEWRFDFPEILDNEGNFVGFDVILGNPPYIQLAKDEGKLAEVLGKQNYETFEREGDIYMLFFERGMDLLAKDGFINYITSKQWMRAGYGKVLRKWICKYNPLILIDLGANVFENATVDTNILMLQNRLFLPNENSTEATYELKALDLSQEKKHKAFNINNLQNDWLSMPHLSEDTWAITTPLQDAIKEKVVKKGKPLMEWNISINYGIKTGRNEAFIIDETTKQELCAQDAHNEEIIVPILRGRDVKKYGYQFADLYLINTYNGYTDIILDAEKYLIIEENGAYKYKSDHTNLWHTAKRIEHIKGNQYRINRIIVKTDYPSIYTYLQKFETDLRNRKDQGTHWTNLRDCAYNADFQKDKIIWQEISGTPCFTFDTQGMFVNDTCRILTGNDLPFLLAYFNSKLFSYIYAKYYAGAGLGKKGIRYKSEFMQSYPVPQISEEAQQPFIQLVDEILRIKNENIVADTTDLEAKIDLLVYQLYGITEEEQKIIEAS